MKQYLTVYYHILVFHLKSMMEYRLNFLMQMFYGPAYVLVLFMIVQTAFTKTPTLGGWTKDEVLLLFSIFHLMYTICILLFMKGLRHFVWEGIRLGQVDLVLTKPMNPQFLIAFSRPELQQLLLLTGVFLLFILQVSKLSALFTPLNTLLFCFMFLLSIVITYLAITSYAASSFFVVRARQVIEFFDKMADFSQYPTSMFPASFQFIAFTILPIAFFSYVPTSFLLGRGSAELLGISLVVLISLFVINRILWHEGLKRYSSASS